MLWQLSVTQDFKLVTPEEHETVAKLCKKLELSDSYAEGLIETDKQRHGESPPPDNASGIRWLAFIADVALADGDVSDK